MSLQGASRQRRIAEFHRSCGGIQRAVMIRKFLERVFKKSAAHGPTVIPALIHGVSQEQVSPCARKVTQELQSAGFAAFVVGGAVRDLALGRVPKDFDVATSATPDQVRSLFRRSRLIGRRFQIVHVMCGREIVEVSTFRGTGAEDEVHADDHGRLLRDNVFGSQQEDARRRDFTINSLYFNPATEEILDYQGGYADLKARRLRVIGDPQCRFREDPVRLLRAVRLASKLGMEIEAETAAPIREMAELLSHVPASRLFDEMLKLLLSGHAQDCLKELRGRGLHHGLLPLLDVIFEQPLGERFVMLALKHTDERVLQDKPVSPAFLFATLLWHEVLAAWRANETAGMKTQPALHQAMNRMIEVQAEKLAVPRRFGNVMKEIWALQPRFSVRSGIRPVRLLEHPRFRAAYDFMLLRCEAGEVEAELGEWWTRFQRADDEERKAMLLSQPEKQRRRRSRRRRGGTAQALHETPIPEQHE
jgi:poly(A) polymerase